MKKIEIVQKNRDELALHITPALIFSLKILQLPVLYLQNIVENEIESNPSLEIIEEGSEGDKELEKTAETVEALRSFTEFFPHISEDDDKNYEEIIGYERTKSLFENIEEQIEREFSEEEKEVAFLIIDAIDENGFLTVDEKDLLKISKVNEEFFYQVLRKIQRLNPPGIGTSSIKESLLVQLEVKGYDKNSLEYIVIRNFYDEFLHQKYNKICRDLGIRKDDFQKVLQNIKTLNPKPAGTFARGEVFYVFPDIIVRVRDDKFQVDINESILHPIRISSFFLKILENPGDYSKDIVKFAKEKVKRAWNLIDSLNRRREFLYNLGLQVVNKNKDFFRGLTKEINTFSIKEMAEILDRSSSTVSRAVKNKYIEGPCGIYKLSQFFEKKKKVDRSSNKVKKLIKEIISKENSEDPFTDQEISFVLRKKGIKNVSRRTVAKYRREMGIPTSKERILLKNQTGG